MCRGQFPLRFQTSYQQTGMIYNNTTTSFILRYIGAQPYLISFIITVLTNDIFHAMFTKMEFKVRPAMKNLYLMKFMKICTCILDTWNRHWWKIQDGVLLRTLEIFFWSRPLKPRKQHDHPSFDYHILTRKRAWWLKLFSCNHFLVLFLNMQESGGCYLWFSI